ncbi:hypothetical protein SAICODRAFT_205633 [Saitoella complicata NRRL Y-17804]|uniref:uncharacterized protein n=1 Tax=Saitoella complicata (strain BCRC 22490 / CBS 7301 / JCM 7358 / NBRC 10748 / NRRL Y-17804) TaxID=698492 RepID=UPI00086820AF|nr:uncharacterized protein SAICODRAFT_205633 [Saitoella complicata NRRL Y-17804]ODQ54757.1 hypothetical protein SAICODRAFT_205633 [Saitoella complicata NRRL Y-17804]
MEYMVLLHSIAIDHDVCDVENSKVTCYSYTGSLEMCQHVHNIEWLLKVYGCFGVLVSQPRKSRRKEHMVRRTAKIRSEDHRTLRMFVSSSKRQSVALGHPRSEFSRSESSRMEYIRPYLPNDIISLLPGQVPTPAPFPEIINSAPNDLHGNVKKRGPTVVAFLRMCPCPCMSSPHTSVRVS